MYLYWVTRLRHLSTFSATDADCRGSRGGTSVPLRSNAMMFSPYQSISVGAHSIHHTWPPSPRFGLIACRRSSPWTWWLPFKSRSLQLCRCVVSAVYAPSIPIFSSTGTWSILLHRSWLLTVSGHLT